MKKEKHDHKATKKLKICLFASVLLAPLIAIGVTCLTHIFNEKVEAETQTATINYKYQTNDVETINDIENNRIYTIKWQTTNNGENERIIIFNDNLQITQNNYEIINIRSTANIYITENKETLNYWDFLAIYKKTDNTKRQILADSTNDKSILYISTNEIDNQTYNNEIDIVIKNKTQLLNTGIEYIQKCEQTNIPINDVTITTQTRDGNTDIYYYAVEQVKQNTLFKWALNTPLTTPINNFVTTFGIESNGILTLLLTYWVVMTAIYIVFDIIIELFVKLTHLISRND